MVVDLELYPRPLIDAPLSSLLPPVLKLVLTEERPSKGLRNPAEVEPAGLLYADVAAPEVLRNVLPEL